MCLGMSNRCTRLRPYQPFDATYLAYLTLLPGPETIASRFFVVQVSSAYRNLTTPGISHFGSFLRGVTMFLPPPFISKANNFAAI